MLQCLKLCLVTHLSGKSFSQYKDFLAHALQGGVSSVQLREKNADKNKIRSLAFELKNFLSQFQVPLIINDYVDIALEVNAEGIHLGQSDISPAKARQMLGENKIIGWSIETLAELEAANHMTEIDYVAASAVFPSKSKTNCKTIWGIQGLKTISQKSTHPVIAIGGIDASNVGSVIEAGAQGVAVISAIHDELDPSKAAMLLNKKIKNAEENYVNQNQK